MAVFCCCCCWFKIFIQMPMYKRRVDVEIENEEALSDEENSTWSRWRAVRSMCEESTRLGVILEMAADLPSEDEIERWLSEPIRALVVPTDLFLTNKAGFPVLSKQHQMFIYKFLRVYTNPFSICGEISNIIDSIISFIVNFLLLLVKLFKIISNMKYRNYYANL